MEGLYKVSSKIKRHFETKKQSRQCHTVYRVLFRLTDREERADDDPDLHSYFPKSLALSLQIYRARGHNGHCSEVKTLMCISEGLHAPN